MHEYRAPTSVQPLAMRIMVPGCLTSSAEKKMASDCQFWYPEQSVENTRKKRSS